MQRLAWAGCSDILKMLKRIKAKVSDRKLRLFGCACCRHVWKDITLKTARSTVEAAEQFSDGLISAQALDRIHTRGIIAFANYTNPRNIRRASKDPRYNHRMERAALATDIAHDAPFQIMVLDWLGEDEILKGVSPALLRCVVGDPFRPVSADSRWLTRTVVRMARSIYDERAFDRLPILADGLEDAGCTSQELLNHCREPGVHVRGCWAVDLVLGKE